MSFKEKMRAWLNLGRLEGRVSELEKFVQLRNDEAIRLRHRVDKLDEFSKDLVHIGVDIHFKTPTSILIITEAGGGMIKELHVDTKDLRELNEMVEVLKTRYRARATFDAPNHVKRFLRCETLEKTY